MCSIRKAALAVGLVLASAVMASAASVTVSSVAISGNTVTVTTATTHGFAAPQGMCLSTGVCTAVATTPSGTTFTFTQPTNATVAACASGCGTATAAPQVIVLGVTVPDQAHQLVNYLCWETTINPLPASGASSLWKASAGSVGASTAQNNALAAGNFMEIPLQMLFATSLTGVQMEASLQHDCEDRQGSFAAGVQPAAYYGFTWDGTSWVKQ